MRRYHFLTSCAPTLNNQAMWVCRACAKRASTKLLRRSPLADNRLAAPSRTLLTTSIRRHGPTRVYEPPVSLSSDWGDLEDVSKEQTQKKNEGTGHQERAAERKRDLEKMMRAVKKELRYTTDPYHIAADVAKKLAENDYEKALMLTQEASKNHQVVVSWNYLIAHLLAAKKMQGAIKLYNDVSCSWQLDYVRRLNRPTLQMKKRAQLPNAHTYTTIFSGLAESDHPKVAVTEALRIYNNMLASPRFKPNSIHLNSVLMLCSRAGDMESLFVILRSANGIRSPDNTTYTIILNALRCQQENQISPHENQKSHRPAVQASREKTIARGKLVWDEVITRWKKGEIIMDEELMCAIGRLLLLGGAAETDSIIRVVGEVLDIKKLLDGQPGLLDKIGQEPTKAETQEKSERSKKPAQFDDSDQAEDFTSSRPAQAKPAARPSISNATAGPVTTQMKAGNKTLSLVMKALAVAQRTKLAARYWDYLVQTYEIEPDRRNYRDYIDCLSTGAASGKAARLLVSMPASIVDGDLYRRGILLCHFDAFNEKAFDNAALIHRAMVRKLRVPDARCMKLYLQVAMTSYRKFLDKTLYPGEREGLKAHAQQMLVALDDVFEPLKRASTDIDFSEFSGTAEDSWHRTWPQRQEILELLKKFIAACDKMLSQNLLDKQSGDFRVVASRRNILSHKIDTMAAGHRQFTGKNAWWRRSNKHEKQDGLATQNAIWWNRSNKDEEQDGLATQRRDTS